MEFISNVHSDIGIIKKTNQDSALILEAKTDLGNVFFSVLCDGMGGLANGEIASACVINAYAKWFKEDFKTLLYKGFGETELEKAWTDILFTQNIKLMTYSRDKGPMGTTVVALLIFNGKYYIINVGDSRAYINKEELIQITEDQTFINREIKLGNMTAEEAKTDPRRNVLLQCVGASQFIEPDFFCGKAEKNDVFILCSDGFRHVITVDEIAQGFNFNKITSENDIKKTATELTDLNKQRKESDNITVMAVKII